MIGTLEDQKKAKPICKLCNEDRSYQDWQDTMVSFIDPSEDFHLGCLQNRVRELVHKSTLALENVKSAFQILNNIPQEQNFTADQLARRNIEAGLILNNAIKNLEGGLNL